MKKIVYFLIGLSITLCVGWFFFISFITNKLIETIPQYLSKSSIFEITYQKIEKDPSCFWNICLVMSGVNVLFNDHQIHLGTIRIQTNPFFLNHIRMKTTPSTESVSFIQLDGSFTPHLVDIKQSKIKIQDFSAVLKGSFNPVTQTGQFSAQTIHLFSFVTPFLPQEMKWTAFLFLKDTPQKISIEIDNGVIRLQGIPITKLPATSISLKPLLF